MFPKTNPESCDLLEWMLTFNPNTWATVLECLWHPYFRNLHTKEQEICAPTSFDWSKDEFDLDEINLWKLIYKEALKMIDNIKEG